MLLRLENAQIRGAVQRPTRHHAIHFIYTNTHGSDHRQPSVAWMYEAPLHRIGTAALQSFLILAPAPNLAPALCSPTSALRHALLSVTQRPLP